MSHQQKNLASADIVPGVITTGAGKPGEPVVPRLELRSFLHDKDVTNLYLLAIDRLQQKDQEDPTSWYQLASIHGRPYKPWDKIGEKDADGRSKGYCTHSSVLFPSWHRPYLALFEQILTGHVFDIANEYTNPDEKKKYLAAAKRFRIPYWDWALNPELPSIVAVDETVTVHSPYGIHPIRNPLFSYHFHPVYPDFGDGGSDEKQWETWQSTVRFPTGRTLDAKSQPIAMQKELESRYQVLRDKTYILLTQTTEYGSFSNDSYTQGQNPVSYNNIESIHNDIHGFAGDDGHMGAVDYAAFDPIFWLHHANVDRIFAIWQALNPEKYVCPQENPAGTWMTPPETTEDAKTPLTPFRKSNTEYWDSNGVRYTSAFGYTYPELKRWQALDPDAEGKVKLGAVLHLHNQTVKGAKGAKRPPGAKPYPEAKQRTEEDILKEAQRLAQDNLRSDVNRLYGSPVVERLIDAFYHHNGDIAHIQPFVAGFKATSAAKRVKIHSVEYGANHWHNTTGTEDDRLHYHEWLVNIAVEKYEVNASFSVHVFLGQPSNDPTQWRSDPNLVGSQVIFANNAKVTGCAKCREKEGKKQKVTGTIPLTTCLGNRLRDNLQLEPEHIIPYLEQNLTWRVQKLDNTLLEVQSLDVSVGHAVVEVPDPRDGAIFPSWEVTDSVPV